MAFGFSVTAGHAAYRDFPVAIEPCVSPACALHPKKEADHPRY